MIKINNILINSKTNINILHKNLDEIINIFNQKKRMIKKSRFNDSEMNEINFINYNQNNENTGVNDILNNYLEKVLVFMILLILGVILWMNL